MFTFAKQIPLINFELSAVPTRKKQLLFAKKTLLTYRKSYYRSTALATMSVDVQRTISKFLSTVTRVSRTFQIQ